MTVFTQLSAEQILAWATLIGVIGQLLMAFRNGNKVNAGNAIAVDTNRLVNGAHSAALNTVVQQAAQIASLTGNTEDVEKLKSAATAAAIHSQKEIIK